MYLISLFHVSDAKVERSASREWFRLLDDLCC